MTVAVGVAVLLFIGELLQEYVFRGRLDVWDIAAHVAGGIVAFSASGFLLKLWDARAGLDHWQAPRE
ncbi:MAG: hypothetical protein AAFU85_17860 [Planctomycetota bacterium]